MKFRHLGIPKWWWAGLPLAGVVYLLLAYVVPGLGPASSPDDPVASVFGEFIGTASRALAPWAPLLFLIAWAGLIRDASRNSRRLDRQTGIESIRRLSWQEFEELLAEAYRRRGFRVEKTSEGADGGVDLVLTRPDGRLLLQAKQWNARTVGVDKIRELFGVVTAERADGGILVTSGAVTKAAGEFARRNGAEVIEGRRLEKMIRDVQSALTRSDRSGSITPSCPSCQSPMVRRVARQGPRKGQPFWGCSRFPTCRTIVDDPT